MSVKIIVISARAMANGLAMTMYSGMTYDISWMNIRWLCYSASKGKADMGSKDDGKPPVYMSDFVTR